MTHQLTEQGQRSALGIISSICHGFDLEQAAALNGFDVDTAKVMLMMVMSDAGIVDLSEFDDE